MFRKSLVRASLALLWAPVAAGDFGMRPDFCFGERFRVGEVLVEGLMTEIPREEMEFRERVLRAVRALPASDQTALREALSGDYTLQGAERRLGPVLDRLTASVGTMLTLTDNGDNGLALQFLTESESAAVLPGSPRIFLSLHSGDWTVSHLYLERTGIAQALNAMESQARRDSRVHPRLMTYLLRAAGHDIPGPDAREAQSGTYFIQEGRVLIRWNGSILDPKEILREAVAPNAIRYRQLSAFQAIAEAVVREEAESDPACVTARAERHSIRPERSSGSDSDQVVGASGSGSAGRAAGAAL